MGFGQWAPLSDFVILLLCNGLQRLKDGSSTGLPEEQSLYLDINLLLWDRHACLASTKPSKLLSLRKKLAVSRATGGCDGWSQSNDLWNSPIDLSCCTQVRRHRALFAACRWFISAPLLVPLAFRSFMWVDQRTPVWGKLMQCLWMSELWKGSLWIIFWRVVQEKKQKTPKSEWSCLLEKQHLRCLFLNYLDKMPNVWAPFPLVYHNSGFRYLPCFVLRSSQYFPSSSIRLGCEAQS